MISNQLPCKELRIDVPDLYGLKYFKMHFLQYVQFKQDDGLGQSNF